MNPTQQSTIYNTYDKTLYRTGQLSGPVNLLYSQPSMNNSNSLAVDPADIQSGVSTFTMQQASGSFQQGKKLVTDTAQGYFLGVDSTDGIGKLVVGNSTTYVKWDGSLFSIAGALTMVNGGGSATYNITPTVTTAAVGGSQTKKILVTIGGVDYYIPLYTA